MRASLLIGLASAAALSASVAFAQDATNSPTAATPDATAGAAATTPASSDTLGDPSKLKAGDPNVVSNGPVPDTPQNRAAYGHPLSHAGRMTKPTGD